MTDLIIVSVKFYLCPTCYKIVVIKELILICYGASCCLTVPHDKGLLLTGPPLNGIHLLVFQCLCYLCKGLLTEAILPFRWPESKVKVVWKQARIRESVMKVFLYLIWWILPIHQLWVAQKLCRKQPIVDFIYSFLQSMLYIAALDAESNFKMLLGMQFTLETVDVMQNTRTVPLLPLHL